jgi:hypothetical protein
VWQELAINSVARHHSQLLTLRVRRRCKKRHTSSRGPPELIKALELHLLTSIPRNRADIHAAQPWFMHRPSFIAKLCGAISWSDKLRHSAPLWALW